MSLSCLCLCAEIGVWLKIAVLIHISDGLGVKMSFPFLIGCHCLTVDAQSFVLQLKICSGKRFFRVIRICLCNF